MKTILAASAAVLLLATAPVSAQILPPLEPENTLLLEVECGTVTIQMLPEVAPLHVAQIKTLTREGFYDGVPFHRVVAGFMAQTGDPTGTGMGRSELPNIPAEFNAYSYTRGAVGMARGSDPNSANSQFFITFAPSTFLNGQYTLWGYVVDNMACIDTLKKGPDGVPINNPDLLISAHIAADLAAAEPAPPVAEPALPVLEPAPPALPVTPAP